MQFHLITLLKYHIFDQHLMYVSMYMLVIYHAYNNQHDCMMMMIKYTYIENCSKLFIEYNLDICNIYVILETVMKRYQEMNLKIYICCILIRITDACHLMM